MSEELTPAVAKMELALLEGKALALDQADVFARFTNAGLPPEIIFRFEELWNATRKIGEKVVHIGRIVILEIIRFIEENPNLVIGIALGAAVGSLVNLVPYLGNLLAPISIAVGALLGGMAGARIDLGQELGDGAIGMVQEVIILANKFFALFASLFVVLKQELAAE